MVDSGASGRHDLILSHGNSATLGPERERSAGSGRSRGVAKLPANQKHQPHGKRWQRYEKPQPGHRLQVDMKFLERISGTGCVCISSRRIDDCTRIRVLKIFDACNQAASVDVADQVIRRLPFRVHLVQTETDNGSEFGSHFHWHLEKLDIRHVRIRPAHAA